MREGWLLGLQSPGWHQRMVEILGQALGEGDSVLPSFSCKTEGLITPPEMASPEIAAPWLESPKADSGGLPARLLPV